MITVESAAFLTGLITTFLANVGSVTLVGWLRAITASAAGDDSAERMGFATLNPLAHIDVFFIISFMLFGFGLERYPFVDPHHIMEGYHVSIAGTQITGRYRAMLFYFIYFLNSCAYLLLAIIALALLLISFGSKILPLFIASSNSMEVVSYTSIVRLYPDLSSLSFTFALIGMAIVHINSLLFVFSFLINMLHLVALPWLNYFFQEMNNKELWVIGSAFVLMYFCLDPLRLIALHIIFGIGYGLAALFGAH